MKEKFKEIIKQNQEFSIKLNMKSGKEMVFKSEFHQIDPDKSEKFLTITGSNHNYYIRYDDIESLDYII